MLKNREIMENKMRDIEQIKKEIEQLENQMFINECADNFYHTRGSYYSDRYELNKLKQELKDMEKKQ